MKKDFPLKVAKKHIEFLNDLPGYRDLSTTQLWFALPEKYRKHVPVFSASERDVRAVLIGMLATETEVKSHIAVLFLERTVDIR